MVDGAMACTTLATFPFLTPDEFDCACRALVERVRSCTAAQVEGGWSSARLVTQVYPCRLSCMNTTLYLILRDVELTLAGLFCDRVECCQPQDYKMQ